MIKQIKFKIKKNKIVRKLLDFITEPNSKRNPIHEKIALRFSLVVLIFLIMGVAILIKATIITLDSPQYRIPKNIKHDFETAILKGCSFSDIKIIFDRTEKINIKTGLNWNKEVYNLSVDIPYILEDMVMDYYKANNTDSLYIASLHLFIKEAKEKYPFDKLSESQKELFEILRKNSKDYYPAIEKDIINISHELFDKNNTIEKYLDKAYQSYIISLVALIITLVQFIPIVWRKIKKWFGLK